MFYVHNITHMLNPNILSGVRARENCNGDDEEGRMDAMIDEAEELNVRTRA